MPLLCCPLDQLSLLRVSGPQGADLLHAQLSQDFQHGPPEQARLAALLNPQGRMLADFIAVQLAPQQIGLLLDSSIATAALQRLSMFVLRLKCTLEDASAQWMRRGLLGDTANDYPASLTPPEQPWSVRRLENGALLLRLPQVGSGVRCVLLTERDQPAQAALQAQLAALPALSPSQWALQDLRAGLPHLTAATQQLFVPQMINFELIGGVNFKKGCYPGQEVVARSQYRGTLKRRMYLVSGPAAMQPGQELVHATDPGQPCGVVVNAAVDDAGLGWALAELKIALAEQPGLHLGSVDGPELKLGALPYALGTPD
ncbi:MAG: folate-binding protein [Thiomonas sp.]|uniref:CAF17-like 4Fe-4S cluster assembly/insertion protein YgfZ n=1 Tax=Thiomonas sp. TaxID=2047785 RepID=UPI002A3599F1|nr:folate-binding protein [Thiomonas sp.]MDY0330285.1 folate-binding protein [Thiomonas sp.]